MKKLIFLSLFIIISCSKPTLNPNRQKDETCMSKVLDLCMEMNYTEEKCQYYGNYVCEKGR